MRISLALASRRKTSCVGNTALKTGSDCSFRVLNSASSPVLTRYTHPSGQPSAVTPAGRCALSCLPRLRFFNGLLMVHLREKWVTSRSPTLCSTCTSTSSRTTVTTITSVWKRW
ncbi:MAG: hypothetical protein FHK79_16245 [Pseudomonas sp.]|nr:MAG: hypothetical protein FHK79_16245 [Pseudomonas sp.]